jgi:ssDNA thymidine ADP-ribosyltransferase, DarT
MKPTDFIHQYAIRAFFHFTESINLPSIRIHGLLSLSELNRLKLLNVHYASSHESRSIDERYGLDKYVRLAFMNQHPMEYAAKKDGRLKDPKYLTVNSEILHREGVKVADGIAYAHEVQIYDLPEACDKLDFDVLYTRLDWKDPIIRARLLAAKKYELLIPNRVGPELIGGF